MSKLGATDSQPPGSVCVFVTHRMQTCAKARQSQARAVPLFEHARGPAQAGAVWLSVAYAVLALAIMLLQSLSLLLPMLLLQLLL